MSSIITTNMPAICLACIVFVFIFWSKLFEKHKYPPGPIPLPIIGNDYTFLAKARHIYRFLIWKKYGNVVSHVGNGRWSVQLFGYDAIHEAFITKADHCSGRKSVLQGTGFPALGLFSSDRWKDLKKQATSVLKEHGMGKLAIEEKVREEFEHNMELLSTMTGKQTSDVFFKTIGKVSLNILNQVIFGRRLDYHDKRFIGLTDISHYIETQIITKVIPFYNYLPWDPLKVKESARQFKIVDTFIKEEIKQHKANLDVDQPKDYIDSFLAKGIKSGDPLFADEDELQSMISQFILAGYDTTSATLTWAILFLINNPSAQQEILDEIQQAIGDRSVSAADKDSMHYTHSFFHEVLRLGSTAASTLPYCTMQDAVIQGHTIPKGTTLLANLYSTCQDEEIYPEPHLFKPERFLNEEGKFVKPSGKQMLPFGIGRRACPGEPLARMEVFMILVTFVQRFEVRRLTKEKVKEKGLDKFAHMPIPFEFYLQLRE